MSPHIDLAARLQRVFVGVLGVSIVAALWTVSAIVHNVSEGGHVADSMVTRGPAGLITRAAVGEENAMRFGNSGRAVDWSATLREMAAARRPATAPEQSCIARWDPAAIHEGPSVRVPPTGREHVLVAVRDTTELRYPTDAQCVVVARFLAEGPSQQAQAALAIDRERFAQLPFYRTVVWQFVDGQWRPGASEAHVDTHGWFAPNATMNSDGTLGAVSP